MVNKKDTFLNVGDFGHNLWSGAWDNQSLAMLVDGRVWRPVEFLVFTRVWELVRQELNGQLAL